MLVESTFDEPLIVEGDSKIDFEVIFLQKIPVLVAALAIFEIEVDTGAPCGHGKPKIDANIPHRVAVGEIGVLLIAYACPIRDHLQVVLSRKKIGDKFAA